MHQPVISVIIPAYNEEKTIQDVISSTILIMDSMQLPYEIIVVDDGSSDRTREIATRQKATVLFNGRNRGKGYAVRKGFENAQGDIIVTIDADGAHKPKEIPDLVKPLLKGMDIVAGSRFLGTGKDSTSKINRLGNFLFNMTIMALTRKRVTDSQTGFRAVRRTVLNKLNLSSFGYEIETEITVKGLKNGFSFQEKPISCQKRMYDISKVKILSDGAKILRTILQSSLSKIEH